MTVENSNHSDGDKAVREALDHLKKAERDLHAKTSDVEHAELEIREAEHELEQALEHPHETEIIVNSRPKSVKGHKVSFDEIVNLAFPGQQCEQNVVFSITYRHAAEHPHSGELGLGGHVKVKNGTVFNVTKTIKS